MMHVVKILNTILFNFSGFAFIDSLQALIYSDLLNNKATDNYNKDL